MRMSQMKKKMIPNRIIAASLLTVLLSHCSPVALGPTEQIVSEEGGFSDSSSREELPTRGRIV